MAAEAGGGNPGQLCGHFCGYFYFNGLKGYELPTCDIISIMVMGYYHATCGAGENAETIPRVLFGKLSFKILKYIVIGKI